MKKCMLIPLYADGKNYNVESQLPIIPRVGDHIELDDPHNDGQAILFRVAAVAFANDVNTEYVDVYLRPDGPMHEMISQWSRHRLENSNPISIRQMTGLADWRKRLGNRGITM